MVLASDLVNLYDEEDLGANMESDTNQKVFVANQFSF